MKGVPLRINIGPRDIEKDQMEFVRRDTQSKQTIERKEFINHTVKTLEEIQGNLLLKSKKLLENFISKANDVEALKLILDNKGGFVYGAWCEDQACEISIKDKTGADIRVIPFENQAEAQSGKCINCGANARKIAVFARAY
jgi:prolyl-tRNA synthetase